MVLVGKPATGSTVVENVLPAVRAEKAIGQLAVGLVMGVTALLDLRAVGGTAGVVGGTGGACHVFSPLLNPIHHV